MSKYITNGWCYIRRNDRRWRGGNGRENAYRYEGDPAAEEDKGISNQRDAWSAWVVIRMPENGYGGHLMIETHTGERIACLGQWIDPGEVVAFRAGHEAGYAYFITSAMKNFVPAKLKPVFIGRFKSPEQRLPAELKKKIGSKAVYFL